MGTMDPLSTIASVIAVAQGVAATKHVVKLIKDIPEIQNEYEDLEKEVQTPFLPGYPRSIREGRKLKIVE
jgi:hypothetical protein